MHNEETREEIQFRGCQTQEEIFITAQKKRSRNLQIPSHVHVSLKLSRRVEGTFSQDALCSRM